jgi:hypothetical protein
VVFDDLDCVSFVLGVAGQSGEQNFRTTVAMVRFQRLMAVCLSSPPGRDAGLG